MDPIDYNGWTPRRPSAGFATRTVDAMLAPPIEEEPQEAEVQPIRIRGRKIGAIGLLLAAALVATSAVGMYQARAMGVPTVDTRLPVVVPSIDEPAAKPPAAPQPIAMDAEEIEAMPPRPLPVAQPAPTAAPVTTRPENVPTPRCDCLSDVMVCGCIETH